MARQISSDRLNNLLIEIGRSLIQYADESWLWSDDGSATTRSVVAQVAGLQRDSVAKIADLLVRRHHAIDFGSYPTEYTSLHYVALEYLLSQLVENEAGVVAECEAALSAAEGDADVYALLQEVLASERSHLETLRRAAADRKDWVVV